MDLLDTIETMQRRQGWMRDELIKEGSAPLDFVGSLSLEMQPEEAAAAIRESLGLEPDWAAGRPSWTDAIRHLREHIEAVGVLVVFNGIVGNNTHRKLDADEFRGFALVDEYCPLIFINSTDFKAAQMFTIVHELVHIWAGAGGVSKLDVLEPSPNAVEEFSNRVTAEFLVPQRVLRPLWNEIPKGKDRYEFLARRFKVSRIVVARRSLDLALISREQFFEFHREWRDGERRTKRQSGSGGDFWNNQNVRVGKRFGAAVVRAVKEGRLLYREAYSLTGLKGQTFDKFVDHLGAEV